MLEKSEQQITHLNGKSFSGMRNLRLLKISNVDFSEDIEYLSNELRFLKWPKYPSTSLPSNFQPQKLFELNLCHSRIKYLWKDMKVFPKLKTIKLSYSHNLIETPDFTMVPNLEILDVEDPTDLDPLQSMGCKMFIMRNEYCFCFEMPSFTNFESDHLWLAYVSRVQFEHDYSPPLSSYLDHLQKSELDPSYIPPQIEPYGSDHEWVGDSTCIHAMFQTFTAENSDSKADDRLLTSEEDHDFYLVELDKKIAKVKTKMEALSSEIEVLVKLGQGAEIIRAKIQVLVSELDDARKIILPITS
ncbi:hypothetical protein QYF36_012158 [Acer negundo]|nr:hypothetical protein QYF36_012158 [Acer negundo]